MKTGIGEIISLLIITLILAAVPTDMEAKVYDDTLRLHILAASDADEDQKIKLSVRDAVIQEYGHLFKKAESITNAVQSATESKDEIEDFVNGYLISNGCDHRASVEISKEWYDTREYEGFTLPKGIYTSFKIIIGEGGGKNWWCILYPPLCTDIATESAPSDDAFDGYNESTANIIKNGKYRIKFKILEIISEAFSQNG